MILGHIGARKGSKGVVGKNFRPIAGKPLIDWSLEQLFRNENIDAVVVSTDDPEVYEHGLKRGALDIGLRTWPSECLVFDMFQTATKAASTPHQTSSLCLLVNAAGVLQ